MWNFSCLELLFWSSQHYSVVEVLDLLAKLSCYMQRQTADFSRLPLILERRARGTEARQSQVHGVLE